MQRNAMVTWGRWSVSTTTGSGIDGAILNVFRRFERHETRTGRALVLRASIDGMRFATSDEGHAYAASLGYLQPFRTRSFRPLLPSEIQLESYRISRARRTANYRARINRARKAA